MEFFEKTVFKGLILFFQDFPFGGTEPSISVVLGIWVFALMFLLGYGVILNKRAIVEEVEPPEIKLPVPSCLVWNKNSLFVRMYHWLWREYPHDICEVTKKTSLALIFVPMMAISAITIIILGGAALISIFCHVGWGILYLIAWGPMWIISVVVQLPNLVQEMEMKGEDYVAIIAFIAIFVSILLLHILWRSNVWQVVKSTAQVVKLAASAAKNKFCLPIKII